MNGCIFREGDAEDLAQRIVDYFGSEMFRRVDARRSEIIARLTREHSWDTVAKTACDVYDRLYDAVRAIVYRGAGRDAFASGADISEFREQRKDTESAFRYNAQTAAAYTTIRECAKPTVAMIRGYSREMGHELKPDFEVAIYHNINVNEDRDKAFAESKRFLDSYYSVDYRQDMLRLWVAAGSPMQCIESLQRYVDAGATTILLRVTGYDQKRQFKRVTEEILPAFG